MEVNLAKTKIVDPGTIHQMVREVTRAVDIDPEYFDAWEKKFVQSLSAFQAKHIQGGQLDELTKLYEKARKR